MISHSRAASGFRRWGPTTPALSALSRMSTAPADASPARGAQPVSDSFLFVFFPFYFLNSSSLNLCLPLRSNGFLPIATAGGAEPHQWGVRGVPLGVAH